METIKHKGKIISIIYRDDDWVEGLNFITPTITVAIIAKPAKDAQVIPIGIVFETNEIETIHIMIVTELIIEGNKIVNPLALFAALLEITPSVTPIINTI